MGSQLSKEDIHAIFAAFQQNNPEPEGELYSVNLYTLLVAVVLSAQATDKGVNKATMPLFATVDTPEKMVALGEGKLREAIKSIGLYKTKAKNVIALSKQLMEQHNSSVPNNQEALEALPGVGRKTANVVRNIGFGEPTIAVDTHVFRVSNRLGLVTEKTPQATEVALLKVVPNEYLLHAHHWLILHGRYVCIARKPKCSDCIVRTWCAYDKANPLD